MGLTIHYSGSFKTGASLSEMIVEVKDIADIYKWEYNIFEECFPKNSIGNEDFNDKIYGMNFIPPDCEPISLTFLSNGKMSSNFNLKFYGKAENPNARQFLYMLFTKTQFAGIQTHKVIIHLLKYISNKYFSEFTVTDEGHYWETLDEKVLEYNFREYNELLDNVSTALQSFPVKSDESIEEYFERVLKRIHLKRRRK